MNATLARLRRLAGPAPAPPDGALLDAYLGGDQAAFALLVERHAGLVFATCRRVLRHRHDAEDAFQATFLVLARRAGDVWPREAVGSWLFGVAHRVALKARTARARQVAREAALADAPPAEPAAPDADLIEGVQRAVARLPDVYRAAVVACDLQGLSRKDAAERLGWSEGTLSGRLSRARTLLAKRLKSLAPSLPAGGLAAALGTGAVAPAALTDSVTHLAAGGAAPAPVAALTEGVVRSMAVVKLKVMAAVVLAACALGYGAFAASGDEPGTGAAQLKQSQNTLPAPKEQPAKPPAPKPVPRGELARRELEVLAFEVVDAAKGGEVDAETLARLRARLDAAQRLLDPADRALTAKPPSDLDPLQGEWQVLTISDGKVTEKRDGRKEWDGWVVTVRGGTLALPYMTAGSMAVVPREYKIAVDGSKEPKTIDLIRPNEPVGRGIYDFTAPAKTCATCHLTRPEPTPAIDEGFRESLAPRGRVPGSDQLVLCDPGLKAVRADGKAVGLRLAFGVDGKRPETFAGNGAVVFELVRAAAPPKGPPPKPDDPGARDAAEARLVQDVLRASRRAEDLDRASAKLQTESREARAAYEEALARLKAFRAAARNAPAPADRPAFTIHVRPLAAPEKVVRVEDTGSETVLDVLAHAAGVVPIKAGAVTAWVVRGDEILPVDLVGITAHGDAKTNYVLKAGDKLFIQAKPVK